MSVCSVQRIPNPSRREVKVNGAVIPHALISREVQNHPARSPVAAWRSAALALILREVLRQEAKRLEIEADPITDSAGRRETDEEARMRTLVEREAKAPEPTEAECRRYYERNPLRFRSPDLYEAAHILFGAPRSEVEAFDRARLRAVAVLAELRANPSAFGSLARLHSTCPSKEAGGSLGQVTAGQTTPEFEAALASMGPGEISSEPVETRYGLHIIRLDRKVEGQVLPFDLVCDRIRVYLAEAVRRRAQAQFVARLLASARVEGIDIPLPGALNVH